MRPSLVSHRLGTILTIIQNVPRHVHVVFLHQEVETTRLRSLGSAFHLKLKHHWIFLRRAGVWIQTRRISVPQSNKVTSKVLILLFGFCRNVYSGFYVGFGYWGTSFISLCEQVNRIASTQPLRSGHKNELNLVLHRDTIITVLSWSPWSGWSCCSLDWTGCWTFIKLDKDNHLLFLYRRTAWTSAHVQSHCVKQQAGF